MYTIKYTTVATIGPTYYQHVVGIIEPKDFVTEMTHRSTCVGVVDAPRDEPETVIVQKYSPYDLAASSA